jgi:IS6 family transposase
MMTERSVPVNHTTIYRWVQKYAPELISTPGGTGRYPTGRPGPGRWMRPIRVGGTWNYRSNLFITSTIRIKP